MIFVIMKQNFETFSLLNFHFGFEENFGEDDHSMRFLSFNNFVRQPVDFFSNCQETSGYQVWYTELS